MAIEIERCYRHPDEETRIRCTRCDRPICPDCMHPAPVGHHCPTCVREGRRTAPRRASIRRPQSMTVVLLAVIVVMFGVELVLGATRNLRVLADLGAMVPAAVEAGQGWRLLTSIVLHADVFHLLFNAWALFLFGSLVEGSFGSVRFTAIFVITGFVASATSFAFGSPGQVSVGASGAVFGLLGAWVTYNWRRRSLSMAQGNLRLAILLVVVNVAFGLTVPGIDNAAHLGGLAAGILSGFAAEGMGRREVRTATRIAGLTLVGAIGVLLVALGPFG